MVLASTEQATAERRDGEADRLASKVLEIVADVAREMRGESGESAIRLDSQLDRELGLDSLARTEIILRLQRELEVRLPEDAILAGTPRELVAELIGAGTKAPPVGATVSITERIPASRDTPINAETLTQMLEWHVEQHGERVQTTLYQSDGRLVRMTYVLLYEKARRVAGGLAAAGIGAGDTVLIMLPTGLEYLYAFFGSVLAGAVPVPIYPPARMEQAVDHIGRHRNIVANAGCSLLVTGQAMLRLAHLLQSALERPIGIVGVEDLLAHRAIAPGQAGGEALAMLQYTSGSTGQPKGVALSHRNLLCNIRSMGKRLDVTSSDVFVSWLPLYHDMGLIGAVLGTLYFGCQLVLMSPLRFLSDPACWLWTVCQARGTISASPNFGYELALKKVSPNDIVGLDLSDWRHALNGAEPVNPATVRQFAARFGRYGLPQTAMKPVYGLAESSVGLTLPRPDEGFTIDRVRRDIFQKDGKVRLVSAADASALEFVACGQPIDGQEVRVVDITGHELPDCCEGAIEFRGESSTRGYYRNPAANAALFRESWLQTGDRGYFRDGRLYITGRIKDMIVRGGRNIHPTELDNVIGTIDGVRAGCVACFGHTTEDGRELLVVPAETYETDPARLAELSAEIRARTVDLLNLPPDRVLMLPPHSIPKTSSGKIRRSETRELFQRGLLGAKKTARWKTRLTLAWLALAGWTRGKKRIVAVYAYSGWAWTLLCALGALCWIAVALSPTLRLRWSAVRLSCRAYLYACGVRVTVTGTEQFPREGNSAVAANHTSYLDSMMLVIAIPAELRFVAKKELASQLFAGTLLRRLNTVFVERDDPGKGGELADAMTVVLERGDNLAVYPEGTFFRTPELRPFRMGVFVAAARSGRPVVPVTLTGVRDLLRSESWLISRGAVSVHIHAPQRAAGEQWQDAATLRNTVAGIIRGDD